MTSGGRLVGWRVRTLVLGGGSHRPQRGALDRLIYPGFAAADAQALVPYLARTDREPGFPDDALRAVTAPTVLFTGENDTERLADSRAAARLIPNCRLAVLAGADHGTALGDVDGVLDLLAGVSPARTDRR